MYGKKNHKTHIFFVFIKEFQWTGKAFRKSFIRKKEGDLHIFEDCPEKIIYRISS